MRPTPERDDDTTRVASLARLKRSRAGLVATAIAIVLCASAAGWLFWPRPAPQHSLSPTVGVAPQFNIVTATEQQILDDTPTDLTIFRFAGNPRILVLDFASLHEQGRMLNRVAALAEKAGLPRDRVLSDNELDAAIRARGETVETFYYGHDYPAVALVRFFALADGEHVGLTSQEERLRALLRQEGWFTSGVAAGLISLPAVGANPKITRAARAAILRHELSHGEFFTDPAYAAYVHDFWLNQLTQTERQGVRNFLAKEGYDRDEEELMYNEMQAYLMFTRDPQFFTPEMAGLTPERLSGIQSRFLSGMPAGWLRDVLAGYQDATPAR